MTSRDNVTTRSIDGTAARVGAIECCAMHDDARARRRARRNIQRCLLCVAFAFVVPGAVCRVAAQDPPPRIGPVVLDLHGVVPRFGDDPQLAASRGLVQAELPGSGFGASAAAHVYLPKVFGVTVGL